LCNKSLIKFLSLQNVLWRFKFSQLKGSSDDGKTKVKLLFQNPDTKQIETKVSDIIFLSLVKNEMEQSIPFTAALAFSELQIIVSIFFSCSVETPQ